MPLILGLGIGAGMFYAELYLYNRMDTTAATNTATPAASISAAPSFNTMTYILVGIPPVVGALIGGWPTAIGAGIGAAGSLVMSVFSAL